MTTNLNPKYRNLARAVGPMDEKAWPLHPFSGNTGAEPPTTGVQAYGWDFSRLLTLPVVVATIQCFAARSAYYDGAPYRQGGYSGASDSPGCRPVGWVPAEPGDLPGGSYQFSEGPLVSGPDLEHFPLALLVAIADSSEFHINTAGGVKNASEIARYMLRSLATAHSGMIRSQYGISTYPVSPRAAHYLLRTLTMLRTRGLIDDADAFAIFTYANTTLLTKWEDPTWLLGTGDKSSPGGDMRQVYNSQAWLVPALWDYLLLLPKTGPDSTLTRVRERLWDILHGMCLQLSMLEAVVPDRALATETVRDWAALTPESITFHDYYEPWQVRAWCVAAEVLHLPAMRDHAARVAAKWPGEKQWLYDASGSAL